MGQQRADFFFRSRHIIAELKCLENDLAVKVGDLLNRRGIIFYGRLRINEVIADRKDNDQLNSEALNLITTSLERHFRSANNQILATKEEFKLPEPLGLIIVINNGNEALEPNIVPFAASRLIMKRSANRTRFPAIHGCLYITELHHLRNLSIPGTQLSPVLNIVATHGQPYDALSTYIDWLIRQWCDFKKITYIDGQTNLNIL